MATKAKRVQRYRRNVPALYRLTFTIEVLGKPGRLEETTHEVRDRLAAIGLRVVQWNTRWANAEECSNPAWSKPVEAFHPSTMVAEKSRRARRSTDARGDGT
jgi:hypothetical protein